MKYDDVLLIHMGGLGDMCLSESTFISLSQHFQKNISALGYSRFFIFFQEYFKTIYSIESAKWLYLFSDYPSEHTWKRIVFVGKDKNGELRKRWQSISEKELIFVDMYPDSAFGAVSSESGVHSSEIESYQIKTHYLKLNTASTQCPLLSAPSSSPSALCPQPSSPIHVEDYQLVQLEQYGIKTLKKEIEPRPRNRVILYPEVSITKSKWHHENFIELYHALKQQGIETYIFESLGLDLPIEEKIVIKDLVDMKTFFDAGGIFVSNDSGMAHFAAMCGLLTITIFNDFGPAIWHPRGKNISVRLGVDSMDLPDLKNMVFQLIIEGKD
jgi:hypothetical protein